MPQIDNESQKLDAALAEIESLGGEEVKRLVLEHFKPGDRFAWTFVDSKGDMIHVMGLTIGGRQEFDENRFLATGSLASTRNNPKINVSIHFPDTDNVSMNDAEFRDLIDLLASYRGNEWFASTKLYQYDNPNNLAVVSDRFVRNKPDSDADIAKVGQAVQSNANDSSKIE